MNGRSTQVSIRYTPPKPTSCINFLHDLLLQSLDEEVILNIRNDPRMFE